MVYTLNQYQKKFHPTKSTQTVRRMIKSRLMPSHHQPITIGLVNVLSDFEFKELYCQIAIEFNLGVRTHERAAEFCIRYNLCMNTFCKIVGI